MKRPVRLIVVVALAASFAAGLALVGPGPADAGGRARAPASFPGAYGFGAGALGGRGGDVAIVTTLADDGPGSLREAIDTADGPRTIVFEVAGIIDLRRPLRITASHLTIAGQSSPGGITIRGYPVEIVDSAHIVLRYLRFRPGDANAAPIGDKPGRGNADLAGDAADALSIIGSEHVIVDHVSASWGMDETLSVTKSADVTVQHSIISEALDDSYHSEGRHGLGSLLRGTGARGYTFWGNLWAHHQRRMPAIGGQQDPPPPGQPGAGLDIDVVNNVMYDWVLIATSTLAQPYDLRVNLEANTYITGPSLAGCPCAVFNIEATADQFAVHRDGNLWDGDGDDVHDPGPLADGQVIGAVREVAEPFDFARTPPPLVPAADAYEQVLASAGASRHRDPIDARIVAQVAGRSGRVIDSQDEVGGWTEPTTAWVAPDTDRDGMPDWFERLAGLDRRDPSDRNGRLLPGWYTNLELYLFVKTRLWF